MSDRCYVFLMPAGPRGAQYQAVVHELAARFGGPRFPVHVTLLVGNFDGVEGLRDGVGALAERTPVIELQPTYVDVGASFTKCVFQRFEEHPVLREITEALRPLALPPADYRLMPHASLFYGDVTSGAQAREAVDLPSGPVRFDSLRIVQTAERSTRAEVVKAWETRFAFPLRGARG